LLAQRNWQDSSSAGCWAPAARESRAYCGRRRGGMSGRGCVHSPRAWPPPADPCAGQFRRMPRAITSSRP
jgi:hypothetical protein